MSWSNSEEEDGFKLRPSDFTPVNVPLDKPFEDNTVYESPYISNEVTQAASNYFYERLGFEVGTYFAGEKRLYQQRR